MFCIAEDTTRVIPKESVKLRNVTGLREVIEALQRQIDRSQDASTAALSTSDNLFLSSQDELDTLEERLLDGKHCSPGKPACRNRIRK